MNSRLQADDFSQLLEQVQNLSELKGLRVHVTGCNGFIPGGLMDFLHSLNTNCGYKLILSGTCRDPKIAKQKRGDSVRVFTPEEAIPASDIVFHGASPANPANFHKVEDLIETNIVMTQNIIKTSIPQSRLVFFSTGEGYGRGHTQPIAENDYHPHDPENPLSSYALSKLMGENLCVHASKSGRWMKVARIFHTYGPGLRLHDGRIQNDLIGDAIQNKPLVLKSDGSAIRSMAYITDTLAGILTLAVHPSTDTVFNVGNSDAVVSILEFAKTLGGIAGLEVQQDATKDSFNRVAGSYSVPNTHRLSQLGWSPQVSLKDGLTRTLRSFNVTT